MLLGVLVRPSLAVMSELGDHTERPQRKVVVREQCRRHNGTDVPVKVVHRVGALVVD